jgi:hypothetical protein
MVAPQQYAPTQHGTPCQQTGASLWCRELLGPCRSSTDPAAAERPSAPTPPGVRKGSRLHGPPQPTFQNFPSHRKFPVWPPQCRKAPAALAVQDRQQVPLRSHRAAGDCRSGGACAARPRTCCRRPKAAGSPVRAGLRYRPDRTVSGRYVC